MELIIKNIDGKELGLQNDGSFGPLTTARLFGRSEKKECRDLAKKHAAAIDDDSRVFGGN